MDDNSHQKNTTLILGLVGGIFLLLAFAVLGYLIGRSSVTSDVIVETRVIVETAEPMVEVQEVTREVIVTVIPQALETPVLPSSTPTMETVTQDDIPAVSETVVPRETQQNSEDTTDLQAGSESLLGQIDLTTFDEVWELVEDEFDGELPEADELVNLAISGSLRALDDDYTRYVRPDIAQRLREDMSGSFSGIGSFVRENEEGLLEIVRPFDGQPADLAGLLAGDVVIELNNKSVIDADFDEVLMDIRGPEGTPVTLTVIREGVDEPLEFTIIRKRIEIPIVESEIFERDGNKIGYIRLTSFSGTASETVLNTLDAVLAENPTGLIFDLRDNGGGFLDQAVNVADTFLPEGVILYERGSKGIDETFTADSGDLGENIPMVVLINAGSASASEIVAGAIQDNERGILIGETSFGKGSVQLVHTLSDGSELRVTIARWFTPSNRSISEEGVTPDIEVPTPPDLGGEEDTQIQRAIEYLLNER